MKNFYKLDFGHKFLNNVNFKSLISDNKWQTYDVGLDSLNQEVLKQLLSIRIFPDRALLFKGQPGEETQIHTDGDTSTSRTWAINLSWGSDSSSMAWYKIVKESNHLSYTNSKTPFMIFENAEVEEIERTGEISQPTLVRIDIPHSVINRDLNNTRYCFSLRGKSNYRSWEEIVEAFKKFIVD